MADNRITLARAEPRPAQEPLTPIEEVQDQLPMPVEIQEQFINVARMQYHPSAQVDDLRLYNYLWAFTLRLPHSLELEDTTTLQRVLELFEQEVVKPLRTTWERVEALTPHIREDLTMHPIAMMEPVQFTTRKSGAQAFAREYEATCRQYLTAIAALRRDVTVAENLFVDPDGLVLAMRERLNDLANILSLQIRYVKEVVSGEKSDIERQWLLRALTSAFNDDLDLPTYLRIAYPQQGIKVIADHDASSVHSSAIMRSIAREWIRNALIRGASSVQIQLMPYDDSMLIFSVTDDVHGGFERSVRPLLGHKQIIDNTSDYRGYGFEVISKFLAPKLGKGTHIVIETPLDEYKGSRISLIFPKSEPRSSPPGNGYATPLPPPAEITFVEMDRPGWVHRAAHDPVKREYYSQVGPRNFFDRVHTGGVNVFCPGANPTKFEVTFNMASALPK